MIFIVPENVDLLVTKVLGCNGVYTATETGNGINILLRNGTAILGKWGEEIVFYDDGKDFEIFPQGRDLQ